MGYVVVLIASNAMRVKRVLTMTIAFHKSARTGNANPKTPVPIWG